MHQKPCIKNHALNSHQLKRKIFLHSLYFILFLICGPIMQQSHCLKFSLKLNESGIFVAIVSPSGKKRIHQRKQFMTDETRRRSSRSVKQMFLLSVVYLHTIDPSVVFNYWIYQIKPTENNFSFTQFYCVLKSIGYNSMCE